MPTFKNITVTISPTTAHHTLPSPLPEYGTLKQSRKSTITTYIPSSSNVNFAISIIITQQYVTLTNSQNESLAAYVYFDGRSKEETATLLRRGQETWISSRWVEMPDKTLAEKEFVFREVGLEVQLGGLGIDSKKENGTSTKKKVKRAGLKKSMSDSKQLTSGADDDNDEDLNSDGSDGFKTNPRRHSLPAAANSTLDDDDDDEDEESGGKATAGQIRVDLFRVLAEGPVKKGEYHPMFKEGEEDTGESGPKPENKAGWEGLEYTAGFSDAKPLDSESISTQSVSHIDQPSSPYATFIFFYRGERQLHRMGIIPKSARTIPVGPNARPRSKTLLEAISGKEFVGKGKGKGWEDFRERGDKMVDEEEDPDKEGKVNGMEDAVIDEEVVASGSKEGEELSEQVRKMKLKRTFTDDPDEARKTPPSASTTTPVKPPTSSHFSPFSGASRYSTPQHRRNGSSLSSTAFGNGSALSPKTPKFGRQNSAGAGIGGVLGGITSTLGPSNGIASNGTTGGSTSNTSDDDTFSPKKRRQSRALVDEEIL